MTGNTTHLAGQGPNLRLLLNLTVFSKTESSVPGDLPHKKKNKHKIMDLSPRSPRHWLSTVLCICCVHLQGHSSPVSTLLSVMEADASSGACGQWGRRLAVRTVSPQSTIPLACFLQTLSILQVFDTVWFYFWHSKDDGFGIEWGSQGQEDIRSEDTSEETFVRTVHVGSNKGH